MSKQLNASSREYKVMLDPLLLARRKAAKVAIRIAAVQEGVVEVGGGDFQQGLLDGVDDLWPSSGAEGSDQLF